MNKKEQIEFINQTCDMLKLQLLSKAERIPESWDGVELRQYLADKAYENARFKMRGERKEQYHNDKMILNL